MKWPTFYMNEKKRAIFKNRISLAIALLMAVSLNVTQFGCSKSARKPPKEKNKSFLWKVSSETSIIYILGSIHVAREDIYPLRSSIRNAFDQSEFLVVEIDFEKGSYDPQETMKRMRYSEPDALPDHISKECLELLHKYMKRKNLDKDLYNDLKPWAVAIMINYAEFQEFGYDPELGIDKHFLKKARGHKEILELENDSELSKNLDSAPQHLHETMLHNALTNADRMEQIMEEQFRLWESGDAHGLNAHQLKYFYEGIQPIRKIDLDDRNVEMTKKIKGFLLTGKTYFVVIGAGHVVGDQGVPALLRKEGFTVEQQ